MRLKHWFYKKVLRWILDQHYLYINTSGNHGILLDLSGEYLAMGIFCATNFTSASFAGARFDGADFTRASLQKAQLVNCKTQDTNFSGSLGKLIERKDNLIDDLWVVATPGGAELRRKDN